MTKGKLPVGWFDLTERVKKRRERKKRVKKLTDVEKKMGYISKPKKTIRDMKSNIIPKDLMEKMRKDGKLQRDITNWWKNRKDDKKLPRIPVSKGNLLKKGGKVLKMNRGGRAKK